MEQRTDKLQLPDKGRKEWVDFGKGISMFLVVLFHSEVYYPITDDRFSFLFFWFRMPFFFFLSGYLFTSDYLKFSLKRKMLQIFRGIVWTYLVFTLVLFVPKSFTNGVSLLYGLKEIALGWASWFVVALGGAQVMFALVLYKTKNLMFLCIFMLVCLGVGYYVNIWSAERLPYYFDRALLVVPFFGLGFFYRIYESIVDRVLPVKWWVLICLAVCYFGCYVFDTFCLHTMLTAFGGEEFRNFPLYLCYALLGIVMMVRFVKLIPAVPWISFMGVNSLVFYYLNGGGIKILAIVYNRLGLHLPVSIQHHWGYVEILFMALTTSLFIALAVKLIRRFCPILIGDKKSFNSLAKKMKLKISF